MTALKRWPGISGSVLAAPVALGLDLGKEALGGFLGGVVVVGLMLALFMCNTGGAWDNAKKYVASRTLTRVDWNNSTLLKGEVVGEIRKLKHQDGPELQVQAAAI